MDRGPKKVVTSESPIQQIRSREKSLVHVTRCENRECNFPNCTKIKRIIKHSNSCGGKVHGNCQICHQLLGLIRYHSKNCDLEDCRVLLCSKIKQVMKVRESALKS